MRTIPFLFSIALFAFLIACSSPKTVLKTTTSPINQTFTDKDDKLQLIGTTNRKGFEQAPFKEWFQKNYTEYAPKESISKKCKTKVKGVEVLAFMGTWCGDSRREIPKFYKVMEAIGMKESQLQLVNLYREDEQYKQGPNREEKGLNIHRVPTFIFYKEGKEIGRIVESPIATLETDVAQILHELPSPPNYKMVTMLDRLFENGKLEELKEKQEKYGRYIAHYSNNYYELNTYGYVLLAQDKTEEAILVFTINTLAYPKDAGPYDSLGEAYKEIGNNDLAIENYKKALELDPESETAKEALEELSAF